MFKDRFKQLRLRENLSQRQMADVLSLTQQAVGKWESGKASPDSDMLISIADYFSVTVDYLLGREPLSVSNSDSGSELAADELQLLRTYRGLSAAGRSSAASYLAFLSASDSAPTLKLGDAEVDMHSLGYAVGRKIKNSPDEPKPIEAAMEEELISRLCDLTPEDVQKVDAFVQGMIEAR